jgi:peroxiredoxin
LTETSIGIEVGQEMPAFALPDEKRPPFSLLVQLEEGPVVLVLYRGDWWPYCNGQVLFQNSKNLHPGVGHH